LVPATLRIFNCVASGLLANCRTPIDCIRERLQTKFSEAIVVNLTVITREAAATQAGRKAVAGSADLRGIGLMAAYKRGVS